jgi:hypothetical protein
MDPGTTGKIIDSDQDYKYKRVIVRPVFYIYNI